MASSIPRWRLPQDGQDPSCSTIGGEALGCYGRAERLLAAYRPVPNQEDLRDFEWFHFNRVVALDESTVLGRHPGGTRLILKGPEGTFLTVCRSRPFGTLVGSIQQWQGPAGPPHILPMSLDGVTVVALSRDGKRLAMARGLNHEI